MVLTYSITISGKVQGVFFRQTARERASALGISGSVKNNDNGDVEIIATGTKDQLDDFLSWCRQGPPKAIVDNVNFKEIPLQEFERFSVIRS